MSQLQSPDGQKVLPLRPIHVIGRAPTCDLALRNPLVSGVHARLQWTGNAWELRDLHSTNGTWVDGTALGRGEVRLLSPGSRVAFGSPGEPWTLQDEAPPLPYAERVDDPDRTVTGDPSLLALPDPEHPELTLFCAADDSWTAEAVGRPPEPVRDGQEVEAGGHRWRLRLPQTVAGTINADANPEAYAEPTLHFSVSADEEHVELRVELGDRSWDLKARAHHYLLLTLARARLEDAKGAELSESAQGWVYQEDLHRMLRMDDNAIYLAVFRARQQFAKAGVPLPMGLVERRQGTRQLRLALGRFTQRTI